MASLTLTMAASTDDASVEGSTGVYQDSDTTQLVGASGGTNTNFGMGWRFTNVTIAGADTVTSAKLLLMKSSTQWTSVVHRFACEAADNAATFSSGSPPGSRSIGSVVADSHNRNGIDGTVYEYPADTTAQDSLGALIETVINRAGWASGNALVIVDNSDQDASADTTFAREIVHTYDSATASSEPQLVITYSAFGVLGPITYFGSASSPADNGTQAGSATPLAVTPPGSMVAGDLVLMIGVYKNNGVGISVSNTGGQSWTTETEFETSGVRGTLAWCRYNGTWSANPSMINASGTLAFSVIMHVFRPPVGTFYWDRDAAQATGTFSAPSTPFTVTITGRTTTHRDTVTLASWVTSDDNSWTSLAGSGWVVTGDAQYRNLQGTDMSATFAHYIAQAGGTATGNVSKNQTTVTGDAGATSLLTFRLVGIPPSMGPVVGMNAGMQSQSLIGW